MHDFSNRYTSQERRVLFDKKTGIMNNFETLLEIIFNEPAVSVDVYFGTRSETMTCVNLFRTWYFAD